MVLVLSMYLDHNAHACFAAVLRLQAYPMLLLCSMLAYSSRQLEMQIHGGFQKQPPGRSKQLETDDRKSTDVGYLPGHRGQAKMQIIMRPIRELEIW